MSIAAYMLPPSYGAPRGQAVDKYRSKDGEITFTLVGTDGELSERQIVSLFRLLDPVVREALLSDPSLEPVRLVP